tara:strand:- start:799 stop:1209 length:411 start_codon:yes stop_codon:yes gene_type:complete
MRYAISYVSSVNPELTGDQIQEVLNFSKNWNNDHDITGILLYSEGNFFQVLEGEQKILQSLFSRIESDKRHCNIIKIFEKKVETSHYDNYECNFISLDTRFRPENFHIYLSQVDKCSPEIQSSVRYILNKFSEGIK